MLTTMGYPCDCTNTYINNVYGFDPSNCSVTTTTICFSSDYAFNNNDQYFYNFIILDNTTLYFTINNYYWFTTQNLSIAEKSLSIMTNLHINNRLVIETNAVINVLRNTTNLGRMSIAGNLVLINPELNNPRIVLWNSTYLHLNLNMTPRPDFQIENPTGNTNCFDVISLNDNSNIDTSANTDHITSDMFNYSYNFTGGKGYLISNKKLMRFCPKDTQLNNEVVCTLKNVYYNSKSPTKMEGDFDYPHCPCDNDDSKCENIKFKIFKTNTVTCVGDLDYIFNISQNITTLNINCSGTIEKLYLYENTNVFTSKKTILNRIYNINFTENGKSFVFVENASNNKALSNCHLMEVSKTGLKCIMCDSNYRLDNDICNSIVKNCEKYNKNNICVLCKTGYVLNEKFECVSSANCLFGTTSECYKCPNQYIRDDNECIYNDKCRYMDGSNCITCITGNSNNKCDNCASNCNLCLYEECTLCKHNFILNNESVCDQEKNGVSIGISIIWCNDEFFIDNNMCNKCSSCFANSYNCDKIHAISCEVNYLISDERKCTLSFCQNGTFKEQNGMCISLQDKCLFIVNGQCVECEDNYILNNNKNCVNITNNNTTTGCVKYSKYGCISCVIGYYLSNAVCFQCSENCTSCIESKTRCLSCKNGFYQGENYTCLSSTELIVKCDKISTITGGCYQCKEGYYRVGMDCLECLSNCSTCNRKDMCLTCNSTNYKTTSGKCLPQNSIIGCFSEVTQNGCSKCLDGYYTVNYNECEKCNDNCTACTPHEKCISCVKNRILFENGLCLDISYVSKCLEISNSKCLKCTFWHSPNNNGTLCNNKVVWWVILICVTFAIVHRKSNKQTTIFKMSRSNISFVSLNDGVVVNKTEIVFGDSENPIKVGVESRELICVGNSSKRHLKIQVSTTDNTEKYTIRTEPKIVSLSQGMAVEFEIFVEPNCSCKINNKIALFSKNLQDGTTKNNQISLNIFTEISTRLDPDELIVEKKLGEGSFGVVYKGSFRGICVAIKKMKEFKDNTDETIEFEKEISMLDKFRSDYIIHFYGAVFIPNKVCMVTEFAQFGSLQDLIKHKDSCEVNLHLRVKIIVDAANGILYLHENGILHRDIKPDNLLVLSLDVNDKVNAKLTDFGSARCQHEKYTKSADIFSFAITMFEVFGWSDAYLSETFKFPWKIAEFVTKGKRLERKENIPETIFQVIEMCWKQNPKERITATDVINFI
ncbi:protein serine/threonine kinase, putative [Entamoeba invadens IP1]|uniref:Protein serine/threonine kinase, putative n=1 Tax=Entamoeba invadens IP1 TaxID=370355 RepID=L7FP76_ENTIV|nr:protein serine/threonine kinase, putative [Entamoeba invadens IP1]ELP93759.1 protein serine/threonine kinase, putative [Entamoeba invadens IP1]|eukprot:XP_004260530.1 protein serine/threonine kinase, putative [Entamoeba invadens IP1]